MKVLFSSDQNMKEEPRTIYIDSRSGLRKLRHVKGPVNIIGDVNGIIDERNKCRPPIINAAMNIYDNHEVVKTLIDMGAEVNVCGLSRRTPLLYAANRHNLKILELLLQHGADVHHTDWSGNTALHWAVASYECRRGSLKYENDLSVVKTILRKNPDVNARNDEGNTPLLEAVEGFHLDIVKELLQAGADVNARNIVNETCMHLLLNSTGKSDIIIELIKAGAPLRSIDADGDTPLKVFLFSVPTMNNELMEDIKALIKTALLVENEKKEDYYVNQDINSFADQCYAEAQEMRTIILRSKFTLCDFALYGGKSKSIVDLACKVMIQKTYKIYDDYIAAHFEREYLYGKVLENRIYTTNNPCKIMRNDYLVYYICKFLPKTDLLNLLRAFTNCTSSLKIVEI